MTFENGDRVFIETMDTFGYVREINGGSVVVDVSEHSYGRNIEVGVSDVRNPENIPLKDIEAY